MKQILTLLILAMLSGCTGYDTSYSLNLSDGKQSVGVGMSFHPRTLPPPHGFSK